MTASLEKDTKQQGRWAAFIDGFEVGSIFLRDGNYFALYYGLPPVNRYFFTIDEALDAVVLLHKVMSA